MKTLIVLSCMLGIICISCDNIIINLFSLLFFAVLFVVSQKDSIKYRKKV